MWTTPFEGHDLKWGLDFEISSYCNAKCPVCPRHYLGSTRLHPKLQQDNISYEQFVEWFPYDILNKVGQYSFCGNFGDPAMNPDFIKILEYIRGNSTGHFAPIVMRTNGGPRDTQFWFDVGRLVTLTVFSVDGLQDTNHLYRRNVKWDKLVANMRECARGAKEYGRSTQWEYLVFKHNQHQTSPARELAAEFGIDTIVFKRPNGMDDMFNKKHGPFWVRDKDGNPEYSLQLADMHRWKDWEVDLGYSVPQPLSFTEEDAEGTYGSEIDYQTPAFLEAEKYDIKCKMVKPDRFTGGTLSDLYISAQGMILPCCYMGAEVKRKYNESIYNQQAQILPYEELKLQNNSFYRIMEILDRQVASKWNTTHECGRSIQCSMVCGIKNGLDKDIQLYKKLKSAKVI